MKIINIGILAHVDAGKTTLTESLLYASGAISEPGSVEKGTTMTDTMFLERQRGITIQAAVTSFQWHRCKVNIVDTPGHMDFLAEVEMCIRDRERKAENHRDAYSIQRGNCSDRHRIPQAQRSDVYKRQVFGDMSKLIRQKYS